jgi:hypothetical protein
VSAGPAIAVALTFVWLGMVLAISFLEAPLKFRAPNVTLQIGLGIGRLVFRALNTVPVSPSSSWRSRRPAPCPLGSPWRFSPPLPRWPFS